MLFIEGISLKTDASSTYDTELISYALIKKHLTQSKLAEILSEKLEKTVTQSAISRWKATKFITSDVRIELLKIVGLDWDMHLVDTRRNSSYDLRRNSPSELRDIVEWRIIISNKQNEEKWINFCKEYSQNVGVTVSPVDFVLMINDVGFNFDYDFDKFIQNKFYLKLLKQWISRYQELEQWRSLIIPHIQKRAARIFRDHYLSNIAFMQVIKKQDGNEAVKYVNNHHDLSYEIEKTSQRSYIFHRSLVFINRDEALGLSESIFDEILIDSNAIAVRYKNSNESESLKEDITVDTSQWSKAEQEIYKQLVKIKKELLEKLNK
jgi:hypothetical protein